MMYLKNYPISISAILIFLFFSTLSSPCMAHPDILMINSYHKGYPWTDDLVKTTIGAMKERFRDCNLYVEYMDTKRIKTAGYLNLFQKIMEEKYRNRRPDIVIVSDDNAFRFILHTHKKLFPGTPVLFMGVNNFEPAMITGHPEITGVVQSVNIEDTIRVALTLTPGFKRVAVIYDNTATGRGYRKQVLETEESFEGLDFIHLNGALLSTDEMLERVETLPANSIILLCIWVRDKTGAYVPWERTYPEITKRSPVPVYGVIDYMLDFGVLGGMVQSPKYHALEAAGMAERILRGESPARIPVHMRSHNVLMFDYRAIRKWNIDEERLPDGVIINRPKGLYYKYRKWVWGAFGTLCFLLLVIMILLGNIIRRKRAEAALAEREEWYRSLFEGSLDAIVITTEDGRILDANAAWCRLFGYKKEELSGLNVSRGWADPMQREIWQKELKEKGSVRDYEFKGIGKDGIVRDLLLSTTVRKDAEGNVAYQNICRDITEQKEAEKRVTRSEKRFRDLFDSVSDLIYTQDLEGRFLTANRALSRIFGYEVGELIGRKASDFMKPEWRSLFEKEYLEGIKSCGHHEGITAYFTRGGRKIYIEYHSNLVLPEEGEPYISGTGRDVTERVLTERQIKKVQDQLQQAQKMEAIGTLAGGISHDFNNLLQAIMGYTQIIMMGKDRDDPDLGRLKEIEKAAQRASELTQQLLTFSRKVESKLRPVDLNLEVRAVEKLLKRTIPKMIRIELHLQEGLKIINADPAQMEQVMMNLGVNARDAMPDGGKLVIKTENVILDEEYSRTHMGAVPGEYVLLSISDTGHGMDRETLEHIFEPFYTTKETGKGTGLGLSMVYGIVKNHQGYIACSSEPGEGTTFRIYFPAIESGTMEQEAEKDEERDAPGGNETILLVDDEAFLRELGAEMLGRFGYTVLQAENGETALEIYEKKRAEISLIVLDLIMPGMGGKKCLEEILRMNPRAKVVIASGYSVNGSPQDVLDAGARGYIRKPYDLRQMLDAVREALDEKD